MAASGLRIGSFAGAPIRIDPTFLILALYVLGRALLDEGGDGLRSALYLVGAIFVAVLLHEFGHAGVAALLKLRSKEIVLTFFGGHVEFAQQPEKRWQDIAVSFAGPGVNLLTAGALYALAPSLHGAPDALLRFLDQLFYISAVLGLFNLLPGYPLDGGRILTALLNYAMSLPRALLIAAIIGVVLAAGFAIHAALNDLWWSLFIALFLGLSAWAQARRALAVMQAHSPPDSGAGGPTISNA